MNNELFVLLVEDDPDDVELMHQALADNDVRYSMELINQGDQVISFLDSCKKFPDVVILDLNIPKLHGREVLKKIKSSVTYSAVPVAILTTASSNMERDNCLALGADVFITKPSSVQGFNEMVQSILGIAVKVPQ
jgi:CheY-like chemotaxis protein